MKTIIAHGSIVTHEAVFRAHLSFENGLISEISEGIPLPDGGEIVDASGCYVMPGGVDVHTHLALHTRVGGESLCVADGFLAGTRAAAWGGTTCVVEHASFSGPPAESGRARGKGGLPLDTDFLPDTAIGDFPYTATGGLPNAATGGLPDTATGVLADAATDLFLAPSRAVLAAAQGQAMVDYGVHAVWQGNVPPLGSALPPDSTLDAVLAAALAEGYASGKYYTTYDARLAPEQAMAVLAAMGRAGMLTAVHAEDHALLSWLSRRADLAGHRGAAQHPLVRPALCEEGAVALCIRMATLTGAPLYIVHVSSGAALAQIAAAKKAGNCRLWAETCPHYLLLDSSLYASGPSEALHYVMTPPLRQPADAAALWAGLQRGSIDVVGSDHCAFSHAQKWALSRGNVFRCPGGVAGVETRLPLLFSEGVLKGRLTLPRFVQVVAEAPARLMGLKDKGRLEVGAHADVLVLDPAVEKTLLPQNLHQATDSTPFAGLCVRGWPRDVWLRGQALLRHGAYCATEPRGSYIPRLPLFPTVV